jgi:nanoRNase/pAp phosphatase (c-di-AMP/oligoRNAs hydrolase)
LIICHNDPDGFASAGILLLAGEDNLDDLRYSTVGYINRLLKRLLKEECPDIIYLLDVNADDSETYIQNLIKLSKKGVIINLYDHHPLATHFDKRLIDEGIEVVRDTSVSCSELIFNSFIDKIKEIRKAEFLLCIGAIGDRIVTPFVQKMISSFRREEIFDVYACLLAGIPNGKAFLYSIFEEKDKDGVGFAKQLYYRATKKRFWIEQLKAKINLLQESIGSISVVHIFQRHIGFAASYLIDQEDIDFAIAIGDGPPDFRNRFSMYLQNFLNFIFRRKQKRKNDKLRISFRSSKAPMNVIVSDLAKKYHGFGGGHEFACGASIPQENLVPFLKEIIRDFKNL